MIAIDGIGPFESTLGIFMQQTGMAEMLKGASKVEDGGILPLSLDVDDPNIDE
jgi:hypothetical protein